MSSQKNPPMASSPKSERSRNITDSFPPIRPSEPEQGTKRKRQVELDDHDAQPGKKLKRSDTTQADIIGTARHHADVDGPEPNKPVSARLVDNTDGGLNESLVGRRHSAKHTNTENDPQLQAEQHKKATSVRTPVHPNKTKQKTPASSRLLDHTDGGLAESLAGHSESDKSSKAAPTEEQNKRSADWVKYPMGQPVDDASEAEAKLGDSEFEIFEDETAGNPSGDEADIENNEADDVLNDITPEVDDSDVENTILYYSDDDLSGYEGGDEEYDDDGTDAENSEVDDSDQEDFVPQVPHNTPTLPHLPATPGHHASHSDNSAEESPAGGPSESPSSLLLPSPVVDLPPLPPSSSPSTVATVLLSTLPTPPASQ